MSLGAWCVRLPVCAHRQEAIDKILRYMKRDADTFVDVVIHLCYFFTDASSQPEYFKQPEFSCLDDVA